jgi:ribosome-associated protein
MRKIPSIADYFVIAGGTSTTQVRAIADNIEKEMKEAKERLRHIEGEREGLWILLDFGAVVAHVFCEETRRYYDLEQLWSTAPQAHFKDTPVKRIKKHAKKKKRTAKSSSR